VLTAIASLEFLHVDIDPRVREELEAERTRALALLTDNLPAGVPSPSVLQRLPARTPAEPEKSPRFRGVLAARPSRVRTGGCGFRAWEAPRPVFVSVGQSAGSVSLLIRLLRGPPVNEPSQDSTCEAPGPKSQPERIRLRELGA
jgi:hypothetical protein